MGSWKRVCLYGLPDGNIKRMRKVYSPARLDETISVTLTRREWLAVLDALTYEASSDEKIFDIAANIGREVYAKAQND